jgi:hypothetical protein
MSSWVTDEPATATSSSGRARGWTSTSTVSGGPSPWARARIRAAAHGRRGRHTTVIFCRVRADLVRRVRLSRRWAQTIEHDRLQPLLLSGISVLLVDGEQPLEHRQDVGGGDVVADRARLLGPCQQDLHRLVDQGPLVPLIAWVMSKVARDC